LKKKNKPKKPTVFNFDNFQLFRCSKTKISSNKCEAKKTNKNLKEVFKIIITPMTLHNI